MAGPKPAWGPNLFGLGSDPEAATAVPATVTRALQGAYHALGTHLPQGVNRNKAARRNLRRLAGR